MKFNSDTTITRILRFSRNIHFNLNGRISNIVWASLLVLVFNLTIEFSQATRSDFLRQGRIDGPSTRIIHGENARQGRFPWFVRLVGNEQCGGSLIAKDLVLTAAHCEEGIFRAEIGKYDVNNLQEGNPGRPIVSSHPHPLYQGTSYYDIMIVKLSRPINNPIYEPVKLNFDESIPANTGDPLVMLGFGSTTTEDQGINPATILQEAPTAYMAFPDCAVANNPETGISLGDSVTDTEVTGDWLCTFLNTPERFAHCFGDSGGPIFIEGDSATSDILVGVISGAVGSCGNRFLPDINQRVSFTQDWIIETGCSLSDDPPAEWNCNGGSPTPPAPTPPAPTPPAPTPPAPTPPAPTPPAPTPPAPTPPAPTPPAPTPPAPTPTAPTPPAPTTPAPVPEPTRQPTPATLPPDNGNAPIPVPAQPDEPTPDGVVSVYVLIEFDDSPRDIAWFISDENFEEFRIGAPWGAYAADQERAEELVYLQAGDIYRFTIEDLRGNGLSEGIPGTYKVVLNDIDGPVLVSGGGNFGNEATSFFEIPADA